MEYRWIEDIREFQDIADKWDDAIIASGDYNPFALSDFIITWWKYYSTKRKLMIFVISDNGDIVAGIPLCVEKKFMRNTIVHVGGQAANLTHFFLKDKRLNVIEGLIDSLRERRGWDSLLFSRVLNENFLIEQMRNISWKSYGNFSHYEGNAGFNGMIDLANGYEYVFRRLNNRLRKYICNGKKEASQLGRLMLLKIKGISNVRELFGEYKKLSVSSFRARRGISAFEHESYSNFFGGLLEVFEKKEKLDAHKLIAGSNTLGISFGYRFGNGFKWILTTYNSTFHSFRPGHLLLDALVQEAVKNGDLYFDMYYGGEVLYKQQWCDRMIPLRKLEIYRKDLFNLSFIWTEKIIRSTPVLLNTVKKIRATL